VIALVARSIVPIHKVKTVHALQTVAIFVHPFNKQLLVVVCHVIVPLLRSLLFQLSLYILPSGIKDTPPIDEIFSHNTNDGDKIESGNKFSFNLFVVISINFIESHPLSL
jgi:hypothetical protein